MRSPIFSLRDTSKLIVPIIFTPVHRHRLLHILKLCTIALFVCLYTYLCIRCKQFCLIYRFNLVQAHVIYSCKTIIFQCYAVVWRSFWLNYLFIKFLFSSDITKYVAKLIEEVTEALEPITDKLQDLYVDISKKLKELYEKQVRFFDLSSVFVINTSSIHCYWYYGPNYFYHILPSQVTTLLKQGKRKPSCTLLC